MSSVSLQGVGLQLIHTAGSQGQVELRERSVPRALGPSFVPELPGILPLEPQAPSLWV